MHVEKGRVKKVSDALPANLRPLGKNVPPI